MVKFTMMNTNNAYILAAPNRARSGLTLLELTIAFTVFAVVLGVTAQSLIYSYGVIALQQQRTSALNDCRSIVAALRQAAYAPTPSDDCPADEPLFPCVIVNWTSQFPESQADAEEDDDLRERYGAFFSLPEQEFEFLLTDEDGNPAVTNPVLSQNTNPVNLVVTTRWTGIRGLRYETGLSTVLTDR